MRRFLAYFLTISMLLLPVISSCVPSGFERGTGNPTRPPGQRPADLAQDLEDLPEEPEAPADDTGNTGNTSTTDDTGEGGG